MRSKPLFLIGFMGTGKSTLGRALAARTGARFTDLDAEAERLLGCTAAAAFAAGTPEAFRSAESKALEALCCGGGAPAIVACGGGTPCFGQNMERMLGAGTVVCLTCRPERLLPRLTLALAQRPLLQGLTGEALRLRVEALQSERAPFYSRAHATFDASLLEDAAEVEATCRRFLADFGHLLPGGPTPIP